MAGSVTPVLSGWLETHLSFKKKQKQNHDSPRYLLRPLMHTVGWGQMSHPGTSRGHSAYNRAGRDPCGIDSFLLRAPPRVCQAVELGKVSLLWSHLSIGMGGVQIRHTYRGDDPQSAQFPPPQPKSDLQTCLSSAMAVSGLGNLLHLHPFPGLRHSPSILQLSSRRGWPSWSYVNPELTYIKTVLSEH